MAAVIPLSLGFAAIGLYLDGVAAYDRGILPGLAWSVQLSLPFVVVAFAVFGWYRSRVQAYNHTNQAQQFDGTWTFRDGSSFAYGFEIEWWYRCHWRDFHNHDHGWDVKQVRAAVDLALTDLRLEVERLPTDPTKPTEDFLAYLAERTFRDRAEALASEAVTASGVTPDGHVVRLARFVKTLPASANRPGSSPVVIR